MQLNDESVHSRNTHRPVDAGRRNLLRGGLATLAGAPLLATSLASRAGAQAIGPGLIEPEKVTLGPAAAAPADMESLFREIKREATPEQLYRFLYAMPKGGDIHHHLGGGFLPPMWLAIATDPKRNGGQRFYTRYRVTNTRPHPLLSKPGVSNIFLWRTLNERHYQSLSADYQRDLKPLDALDEAEQRAWMSAVVLDEAGEGRDEFFEYHWTRLGDLMASIHVMTELFVENMKLFGAEGTPYLEIQRGYSGYRDNRGNPLPPTEAEAFWANRLAQPDAIATGVQVRWQAVVLRFADNALDVAREHFAFIDANRERWVGINMAGREDDNRGYPRRFTKVFDEMLARYPGIGISIHAGEAEKPDDNIRDTLRLGASRIGHGINLIWDTETMQRMRYGSNYLIEINLVSNELLGYVPDLSQHPFPVYLRQGIPCCLNTDDRGMWDSNFTDEIYVAVTRFNLSFAELKKLAVNSLQHAFAEPSLKAQLLADYEAAITAFAQQFTAGNWRQICDRVPAITHGYGSRVLGLKLA